MNSLHNGNAHERESSWKALSGGSLQHGTCSAPGTELWGSSWLIWFLADSETRLVRLEDRELVNESDYWVARNELSERIRQLERGTPKARDVSAGGGGA
jgi:hypothetical protein